MKARRFAAASAALLMLAPAAAEPARDVIYGDPPDWVLPPPAQGSAATLPDAAFRIIYQDSEERITQGKIESYNAYRIKILKPEALPLGNVNITWSPSAGQAMVHHVRIIRDEAVIDVLKQARFKVLERETGLEQSMLDGNLTAALQVPGLQLGDELEFAGTISRAEPIFGTHAAGAAQLPTAGLPGMFRYRLLWLTDKAINWRLTKDLPSASPKTQGGFKVLQMDLQDPPAIPDVQGAPARYNVRRTIEYSDYAGWPDVSKQLWPAFEAAARLQPNSPIRAEAAKIAAASADPVTRAESALRLVQDRIRYVYVGLGGGNYVPAPADETWQRKFGDCKAKTVLLLALLRELGIQAEPVLVNSKGGDGMDERLPDPVLFDHVLVKAHLGGRDYWLDGTRLGDRHLDKLPQPVFEWGLPLSATGAPLLSVPAIPARDPQSITIVDIDATAGFAKDATWTVKTVLRGDEAFQIRTALSSVAPADAERLVKSYWHEQASWVEPQQVSWRYDERNAAAVLTLKGTGKVDWEGDGQEGHSLTIPGAGFYAPDKLKRPDDQDQSASWAVEHPRYRCWVTSIQLPPASAGFHWGFSSKPVNRRLGGVIYWRAAGLRDNLMRTVMSRRSFAREISAADAKDLNAQIATFDNNMSSVEEEAGNPARQVPGLPFTDEPDWAADASPCAAPSGD